MKGGIYMNSWWFRTKPRSILRTFEWFPYFAELEGQNWNYKSDDKISSFNNKPIYPIRRKYIYNSHWEELEEKYFSYEDYLSGRNDVNETESAGRNDKTTYEFYGLGYVDKNGIINVTKTGELVKNNKMNENLLIKILLKMQFPSPAVTRKSKNNNMYVFPMELILNIFKHFDALNKYEIGYLFMCNHIDKLNIAIDSINEFQEKYKKLDNKLNTQKVTSIFTDIMNKNFPEIKNKPETYYKDYSDALFRTLEYTGLFSQKGRGYYAKIFIPEHAKLKVELLQNKYKFIPNTEKDLIQYMEWYGNPYNLELPWENIDNLQFIVDNKLNLYKNKINKASKEEIELISTKHLNQLNKLSNLDISKKESLMKLDKEISDKLLSLNEELFVKHYSKTDRERTKIIEKFEDIMAGNEDMAALWLECNTWKSLVAINGEHYVKRNFKIEDDLTPRAFAPGRGNTPDMELYKNGYILIPEVSLMTGVRQWEHEGSSVIDHVYKFIERNEDKQVLGIFISSKMNIRTIWQFFILNRESWIGKPVPVVPLTIKQYISIIQYIYDNNLNIDDFKNLIEYIHKASFKYETFTEWEKSIDSMISKWQQIKAV